MSIDRRRSELRYVTRKEKELFLSIPPKKPWIWLLQELMESPAFRVLSRVGYQFLFRLIVEHCAHAGKENGRLAVGWNEFEAWGINRGMISRACEEVTRLGFVQVVDRGRKGYGSALGRRALFKLTFQGVVGSDDSGPPTNEWQRLTEADALAIADDIKVKDRRRKANRVLPQSENIERGVESHTGDQSVGETKH